jgi:hypothetical protein
MDATTALAIYRAEKDKALRERRVSHVQLMAEAQEAFRKMLADAQLARKGGRPKGSTNAAAAAPVTATAAPVAVPGKLVLKTAKTPAPAKRPEKVTESASAPARKAKPAKTAVGHAPARAAAKRASAEKRAQPAKARTVAKPARRVAAPVARKGAAKKPAARKQAASRERTAKSRKR